MFHARKSIFIRAFQINTIIARAFADIGLKKSMSS
jgi:hypothetical protein